MSTPNALERIYGEAADVQQARYTAALATFARIYGPGPVHAFRAPGRVNLIGEHTDYNGGFVLPVALDRDVLLLARPRPDLLVRLHNVEPDFAPHTFTIGPTIPSAPRGDWSNYARGAAQMVAQQVEAQQVGPPVCGMDGLRITDYGLRITAGPRLCGMDALVVAAPPHGVPRGAGVSSSSALTVVAALALAHLNGWQPEPVPFARMCSEAEWYVGTRGGIMDQFIALLARPGHALFLDCRPQGPAPSQVEGPAPSRVEGPDRYTFAHVPLPSEVRILVADTGVRHTNVRGEYNLRVAACRTGVACLRPHYPGIAHLRDVQDVDWAALAPLLPEVLSVAEARARGADLDDVPLPADDVGLRVRACCRHVHSENGRVRATVAALEAGDIVMVGRLLDQAHASARDDYEISCPELEALVGAARAVEGTVGARLTGAGWGGCIVALVRQEAVADFEAKVSRRYRQQVGWEPTIFACRAGSGAGLVFTTGV
jgi:galactokinase